jgi:uncharacterized phage protein (TIGR01671 family)
MLSWGDICAQGQYMANVFEERLMTNPPKRICNLMQFTGLVDKNGVEIYERDIVRISGKGYNFIAQIVFNDLAASYEFRTIKDVIFERHSVYYFEEFFPNKKGMGINTAYFEVIGNVFQNPEILSNQ